MSVSVTTHTISLERYAGAAGAAGGVTCGEAFVPSCMLTHMTDYIRSPRRGYSSVWLCLIRRTHLQ